MKIISVPTIILLLWLGIRCTNASTTSRRQVTKSTALPNSPLLFRTALELRAGGRGTVSPSPSSSSLAVKRGGAKAAGKETDNKDDGAAAAAAATARPWWNTISAQKVAVALSAFALQQTLTRMVDAGRFPLLKSSPQGSQLALEEDATKRKNQEPTPMVQGRAAPPALLEEAPQSTMPESVFNLVKCIVGVGVLSGIAAFGNARSAFSSAFVIITVIGVLSAIGLSWTGQVCATLAQDKTANISMPTYRQAWSYSVSDKSSWIPAVSTTSMTFLACLCFSMVLADSLTDLIKPIVTSAARTPVLWGTTACVLLPLCWMKDLKSLAPFSLLGVLGMVYTGLAMAGRFLSGSYDGGSPLLRQVPVNMQPSFGSEGWQAVFKPGSVILVSMLSTAYMCHYNAPKFHAELKDNTMARFNTVVAAGFGASILIIAFIACIGFATFGSISNGFILNNYSSNDAWMSLSRPAVALSLTFSYPLCFQGLREGILDLAQLPVEKRVDAHINTATVVLLLVLTGLATLLKDVSIVLALTGATLGNLLCYVYPAIMYGRINPNATIPAILLGATGLVLGVIGVKLVVESM